jgi:phage tail protein X
VIIVADKKTETATGLFDPNSAVYQAIDTATPTDPFCTNWKLTRILACLHNAEPKGEDRVLVNLVDSDLQYLYEALRAIQECVAESLKADRGIADYGEVLERALCLSWGKGKHKQANLQKVAALLRGSEVVVYLDENAPKEFERGDKTRMLEALQKKFPDKTDTALKKQFDTWLKYRN